MREKTKKRLKLALKILCWTTAAAFVAGVVAFAVAWCMIDWTDEGANDYPGGVVLRDSSGEVLRVSLGEGDVDCRPYYKADADDWIVKALVASEDGTFWTHCGVRPLSVLRAAVQNILTGRRVSGASTITMQAVRLIDPHPKNLKWKAIESIKALKMERKKDKKWIISQYLNRAPYGSNFIGIEAAASGWFGKQAKDLGPGEAALLAGMVQAPSRFRPDRWLDRALRRIEPDEDHAVRRKQDRGVRRARTVADLYLRAEFGCFGMLADPVCAGQDERIAQEIVRIRREKDLVFTRVDAADPRRDAHRHAGALALPDRVRVNAVVPSENAPVRGGGERPARHGLSEMLVQEFRRACILAFLRFRVREPELAGDLADFGLRHAAEREDDPRELFLREPEEEIRLVLFAAGTAGEDGFAVFSVGRFRIMSRGERRTTVLFHKRHERAEFDPWIANGAWIRREAGFVHVPARTQD